MRFTPIALITALPLGACTGVSSQSLPFAQATILSADGKVMGAALLTPRNQQLQLDIAVSGLTPVSIHGIHLHTVGKCEAPNFASAGGHLNPLGKAHGSDNPDGQHLGDLPNLATDRTGSAKLSLRLPGSSAAASAQMFDADGTAIVIHADRDDLRTDPSGNSGARIACGVFSRGGS